MTESERNFEPLYYPGSAAELLTEPILSLLMLGFTVGLEMLPVALADRKRRYDLYPDPKKHWLQFCRELRSQECGQEPECLKWDDKVAKILLGDMEEEYPGQRAKLMEPFECHVFRLDVAEPILVGGKPFAVLHGGQMRSTKPAWQQRMRERLHVLLPGRSNLIERLMKLAEEDERAALTPKEVGKRHSRFKEFARQIEELFDKVYNQRRAASGERLLKSFAQALASAPATDWDTWREELSRVLAEVSAACRLDRMGLLIGSKPRRFVTELQASNCPPEIWGKGEANIGPYWEQIRHRATVVGDQSWAAAFRAGLAIADREPCAIAAQLCRAGAPAANSPAILVCVGDEVGTPMMVPFIASLAAEATSRVASVCSALEVDAVRRDTIASLAYSAHDVKLPLHAAFSLAESIERDLERLGITDREVTRKARELVEALQDARVKAQPFERTTVREMNIQCELTRADVMPLIDRAVALAKNIEPDRGITVTWLERPKGELPLDIDEFQLGAAFDAILENAVKYSFERRDVRVSARTGAKWFLLTVSNFGVGIPLEKLLDIFEFGGRAQVEDKYRGRERSGSGLGLPIARRIIQAHRGDINIESRPPGKKQDAEVHALSHHVVVRVRLPMPKE